MLKMQFYKFYDFHILCEAGVDSAVKSRQKGATLVVSYTEILWSIYCESVKEDKINFFELDCDLNDLVQRNVTSEQSPKKAHSKTFYSIISLHFVIVC